MANGMDSDGYVVVSSVPKGFKRELARLLKSQSESPSFTGRRVTRSQNSSNKRLKASPELIYVETTTEKPSLEDESMNDIQKLGQSNDHVNPEEEHKEMVEDVLVDEIKEFGVASEEEPKSDVDLISDDEMKSNSWESAIKENEAKDMHKSFSVDESKGNEMKIVGGNEDVVTYDEDEPRDGVMEPFYEEFVGGKDGSIDDDDDVLNVKDYSMQVEDKGVVSEGVRGSVEDSVVEVYTRRTHGILKKEEVSVKDSEMAESEMLDIFVESGLEEKTVENVERLVENHVISDNKRINDLMVTPNNGALEPVCENLPEARRDEVLEKEKPIVVELNEDTSMGAKESGENAMLEVYTRRVTRGFLKSRKELSEKEDLKEEKVVANDVTSSLVTPAKKLEMKMSKKIELKKFPTKLKELLDTGLLEGLPVKYVRGTKVKGLSKTGLKGIIKGTGILCFCDRCNGTEVLTPVQFELHAGSGNKRPPEYIYLENGNSLRDVLNACKDAPSDSLEVVIQMAIGCSSRNRPIYCLNCKGSIIDDGVRKTMLLCNSCVVLKETHQESKPIPGQTCDTSVRSLLSDFNGKSSDRVPCSSSARSKSHGRLTRKDLRMHKLVFEEDVLPDGTALAYYSRGQKLLEGYKKGFGVFCFCCNCEVSPSQFEAHAGMAARRKPFHHIFTSNGMSLHELSINLSKVRKLSAEENDDLCSICADGGDLLCCDNCPRAFHTECITLPNVPQDTWYCKYCQNMFQKEKFVERNANAIAAGRIAGVDPMEQITKRCIRIVETLESEASVCVLCRAHDFSNSGFGPRTVIICDQCEKEYHVGCLKEHNMDDLKELPNGKWFCCEDCNRIHSVLQKMVTDGEKELPHCLLNNIKRKHEEKGSGDGTCPDIRWRILSGKIASDDTRLLLSKAVAIFHDRFDPIADSSTSRLDLIPHMVYGRKMREQEFGGMYCVILTVNSVVVSAGIIRIFGQEVAELPLVATSTESEGLGYFQSLFSCIESLLVSLNVSTLVLPAADEAESIWMNKFGFVKITQEELMQYRKDYQMMIFQGTSVLHKAVSKT